MRTRLEELFGQDVFVGVRVTRSRLRGDPDFTQAAVSALSRNSNDLTTLFSQIYGTARAEEFRRLWESQQEGLVAYARAVSQHGQAAKAAASSQLNASAGRIAQFLNDVTSGGAAASVIGSRPADPRRRPHALHRRLRRRRLCNGVSDRTGEAGGRRY